ncbi:MAG TPA: ParB/RepB/Spo0J family partition protein [Nitrososphaerales archaeon]|nr:ParB/RepB/Spo0J family partition protein [Nitrososphaerales archaeon]
MSRHLRTYLESSQQIEPIETSLVIPSQKQVRIQLGDLSELADSIRVHGLLQPVLVRPMGDKFEIVCGHRRFEACRKLMKRHIDCIVRDLADIEAYEFSIIENVQRDTLSSVEEARAYKLYVVQFGWGGVSDLGKRIGKSQEYISHRISLLELPDDILAKVDSRKISTSQAQEIVWLKNQEDRTVLAGIAERDKLSITEIRKMKRQMCPAVEKGTGPSERRDTRSKVSKVSPDKRSVDDAILDMRVALVRLDSIISRLRSSETKSSFMQERFALHGIIDRLIGIKIRMAESEPSN